MLDHQPHLPDTDYFFIGNGTIMAAIQWSRCPAASPYGIVLCDPERMSRKNGSLLFHPELGLARTMLAVVVNGIRHTPRHNDVCARWQFNRNSTVVVQWNAGPVTVTESFFVQNGSSALVRDVEIASQTPASVVIEAALYANPLFFDRFGTRAGSELYAEGYAAIGMYAVPSAKAFERFLSLDLGTVHTTRRASILYNIEAVGTHDVTLYPADHGSSVDAAMEPLPVPEADAEGLGDRIARAYRIACSSLRATVSTLGTFDASIWQYDFSWGLDAAMVATAAACSGQFELAHQVLTNILGSLTNAQGMVAEASRFRGGPMAELNGNGAVLDALWHHWHHSGDDSLLRGHWDRIVAIAEYPLRDEFSDASGLLRGRRDLWERTPWMGVREGFELAHQVFCSVGLSRAAEMADMLGHAALAERWHAAASRIADAMLNHPTYSLVDGGAFVHRRLLDGTVQRELLEDITAFDPEYAPYVPTTESSTTPRRCEPDAAASLPMVYGLVAPSDPRALATLEQLLELWNRTGIGGYCRYHPESDPDSPGPWPFATAFIAAAELEAGLTERACRSIEWLINVAGAGGSWFEFYGTRLSPPHPPTGIIVWGWAQFIILVVHHVLGARIHGNTLVLRPRITGINIVLHVGRHRLTVQVDALASATLDGLAIDVADGCVRIPLPLSSDRHLEFRQ